MHIIEVVIVMSGDQEVFKVPSLPISRAKSEDETVKNEGVQQEVEKTSKLITALQTEGTDKCDKAKSENEGNLKMYVCKVKQVPVIAWIIKMPMKILDIQTSTC